MLFGWGTNASKRCYATRSVVELGSHSSRKPSGSSLTSGSAKNPRFCEAKTSTLVPRQSRSGIRFAFAALFVGAFCEHPRANAQRQSRSLSPQADLSSPLRSTHSVRITEQSGVTPVLIWTCRQRSQSERGKFAKGKRWTPVPTKDTLHFSKNML